jgi:hypothetical protein
VIWISRSETAGAVITPIGAGDDFAYDLAMQPDGKFVVVGAASNGSNSDFALARYMWTAASIRASAPGANASGKFKAKGN